MDKIIIRGSRQSNKSRQFSIILLLLMTAVLYVANYFNLVILYFCLPFLLLLSFYSDLIINIIIDDKGIKLTKEKRLIEWSQIENIVFNINSAATGYKNINKESILIKTKNESIEIEIKNLRRFIQQVKSYNSKHNSNIIIRDKYKDEVILPLLTNKDVCDDVMLWFAKYRSIFLKTVGFGSIGIIFTFVLLQYLFSFPYLFAIGFFAAVVCLSFTTITINKRFKSKATFLNLTDDEYKAIYVVYFGENSNKKPNYLLGTILLVLITAIIVIISYFVSQ